MKSEPPHSRGHADELRTLLRFRQTAGEIWLGERRAILLPADYLRGLRDELLTNLGMERAHGALFRMGYEWGRADATMIRNLLPDASIEEIMRLGPEIHGLEGLVIGEIDRIEIDRDKQFYYAEASWQRSWESEVQLATGGATAGPTCFSQTGFASGYATALLGFPVVFKEVECSSCGAPSCKIVGKARNAWPQDERNVRFLEGESINSELSELREQVARLEMRLDAELPRGGLIGVSGKFVDALNLLAKAAHSDISVLLLGETGVGKEAFARWLHDFGPRSAGPFVAVNCGAIPPDLVESELFGTEAGAYTGATKARAGRFERAHGGTIFLDEIGDLPLSAQVKLLRVLQDGIIERLGASKGTAVDVRVVSATNVDLEAKVADSRFRSDLFYRIAGFPVKIPPLRERRTDILPLAEAFLVKANRKAKGAPKAFSDLAVSALISYDWPGNVRELENVVERSCLLAGPADVVGFEHIGLAGIATDGEATVTFDGRLRAYKELPIGLEDMLARYGGLEEIEAALIRMALERADGNISAAARLLGISRPKLEYRARRKYGNADTDMSA